MLFNLIIIFHLTSLIYSDCPNGLLQSSDKTSCFSFFGNRSYFFDAQDRCKSLNGTLAVINNAFDNINVAEHALLQFTESTDSDFWFGATDLYSPGNWTWIDDSPLTFTDWNDKEPRNLTGSDCGAVISHGGRWIADDCFKQKPFVCSSAKSITPSTIRATTTTKKPLACPGSWTYHSDTGYCYKIMHKTTWIDAELKCNQEEAHLASIHSLEEAAFLTTLFQGDAASIGLYRDSQFFSSGWKWTDGTPVDFLNWEPGEPDNADGDETCGEIWANDQLNDFDCGQRPNFICKKRPS